MLEDKVMELIKANNSLSDQVIKYLTEIVELKSQVNTYKTQMKNIVLFNQFFPQLESSEIKQANYTEEQVKALVVSKELMDGLVGNSKDIIDAKFLMNQGVSGEKYLHLDCRIGKDDSENKTQIILVRERSDSILTNNQVNIIKNKETNTNYFNLKASGKDRIRTRNILYIEDIFEGSDAGVIRVYNVGKQPINIYGLGLIIKEKI